MDISTIGGFSFCGKHINNNKLDILLISVERDAMPDMSNTQSKRIISVNVGVYGKTAIERKRKTRLLLQDWVDREGPLSFDDDESLFFEAKLTDKTPISDLNAHMDSVTLVFEASRKLYNVEEKTLIGQNISVKTLGNTTIETLFKVNGNCTVTCEDTSFTIANVTTPVYIDSKRMVVYTLVGGKEINKAIDYTCTSEEYFIRLKPNTNVTITSTSSVELKYRDTYIV